MAKQGEVVGQRSLADEDMLLRQVGILAAPHRGEGLDRMGQGVGAGDRGQAGGQVIVSSGSQIAAAAIR